MMDDDDDDDDNGDDGTGIGGSGDIGQRRLHATIFQSRHEKNYFKVSSAR